MIFQENVLMFPGLQELLKIEADVINELEARESENSFV